MGCDSRNSEQDLLLKMFKGVAKALTRLRVCAGWSEPVLVAHTTLLEISCHGSMIKSSILLLIQHRLFLVGKQNLLQQRGSGATCCENNNGTDQTAQMHRLVCAIVVGMQ